MLASQKWWFLVAKTVAPVRGMEKGKFLSLRSRERGALFQGSLCSPLKSGGFFGKNVCTSKGYGERETSLASLEREGALFQGLLCSPLKSGGFFGKSIGTSKGYGKRETTHAHERGRHFFRARFAHLSKVVVFLALLGAPVWGI